MKNENKPYSNYDNEKKMKVNEILLKSIRIKIWKNISNEIKEKNLHKRKILCRKKCKDYIRILHNIKICKL